LVRIYSAGAEFGAFLFDEVHGMSVTDRTFAGAATAAAQVVFGISTVEEYETLVVAARRLAAADARSN